MVASRLIQSPYTMNPDMRIYLCAAMMFAMARATAAPRSIPLAIIDALRFRKSTTGVRAPHPAPTRTLSVPETWVKDCRWFAKVLGAGPPAEIERRPGETGNEAGRGKGG